MRRFISFLTLLFLLGFLCACAGFRKLPADPRVRENTLPNGLSYRILENKKPENRILLRLVVRTGSLYEDDDQRGIAHLVEHMAFEGSEHFGEMELVHYFESIGMVFGPDVNAYTSFGETVYQLEVPADDPAMLDTALLVLRDWMGSLSFPEEALEKERLIVTEEWRLGRGYNGRVRDRTLPFLLAPSRFAERAVIGDPEIIRTASRERVMAFYRDWYRSERMTVIIVGDFGGGNGALKGADIIEEKVIDSFSGLRAGEKGRKEPSSKVPRSSQKTSLVIADTETPYPVIELQSLFPPEPVRTEQDYAGYLTKLIAAEALGERLAEKALQADAPFLEGGADISDVLRQATGASVYVVPQDAEGPERAFTALLDELDRFTQFGITAGELARRKEGILSSLELDTANWETVQSGFLINELIAGTLNRTPVMTPAEKLRAAKKILPSITVGRVNRAIRNYLGGRLDKLIALVSLEKTAASSENAQAETEAKITEILEDLWKNYRPAEKLTPYPDAASGVLYDRADPPGTILAEKKLGGRGEVEVTAWTLSNGATVLFCPTDFEKAQVLFTAVSYGGLSTVEDADYPSGEAAADYLEQSGLNGFGATELSRLLAGKQVSVQASLGPYSAGISGRSASVDAETLFQLVNLYFTAPYFTDAAWSRLLADAKTNITSRKNNPASVFSDKINALLYGSSLRHGNGSEASYERLDKKKAEAFWYRYFSRPDYFTFILSGDLDAPRARRLVEQYLASIGVPKEYALAERVKDRSLPFPPGKTRVTVKKGLEAQAQARLVFGGANPPPLGTSPEAEQEVVSAMADLVELRLRETLREKIGGTYGVRVSATLATFPSRRFLSQISFGMEPKKAEDLVDVLLSELSALQNTNAAPAELGKIREAFVRKRETALKTTAFWHTTLVRHAAQGELSAAIGEEEAVLSQLTAETMRSLIRRYFPPDTYVRALLLPED